VAEVKVQAPAKATLEKKKQNKKEKNNSQASKQALKQR
jgi:hypothetical protein